MRTSLLALMLAVVLAGTVRAQTWTGAAAPDANWSNPGNWIGGAPVPGVDTQVTFASGSTDPNQNLFGTIGNQFIVNRITFSGSFTRTITGMPLSLKPNIAGVLPAIVYDGNGSPRFTNDLYFFGSGEIRGAGTGTLRLSNPVSLYNTTGLITKTGAFDLLLEGGGFPGVTINNGRVIAGGTSLSFGGPVEINVPNGLTFAPGATQVSAYSLLTPYTMDFGAVTFSVINAAFTAPVMASTGGLEFRSNSSISGGGTINHLYNGTGSAATLLITNSKLTLTSTTDDNNRALNVTGRTRIESGGRLELVPGAVGLLNTTTTASGLTISGIGSALLAPASTLKGGPFSVVNGATAAIGTFLSSYGSTDISAGGSVSISGTTAIAYTPNFSNYPQASVAISGVNASWTTARLHLGGLDGVASGADGSFIVAAGAVARVTEGITILSPASTISVVNSVLSAGSIQSVQGRGQLYLSDPASVAAFVVGSDNTSTNYSGGISDGNAGPGSLTKVGTGTLTLSGSLNHTGVTAANAGTLLISGGSLPGGTFRTNGGDIQFSNERFILGSSGLFRPDGTSFRMQNVTISGGFVYGPGLLDFTGAPSTVTGTTLMNGARTVINDNVTFTAVTSNASTQVRNTRTLTWDGGTLASAGSLTVEGGATANVRSFQSSGVITTLGGGVLNNSVSALVLGGGSRTFVGTAAAPGGTINLGGQALELNGGLLVNNGTITGTTNVNFGSLAMGAGTYGPVNVTTGGRFSPGNSPGRVTSTAVLLGPGSSYQFEVNNATGTAGVNWDLWEMSSLNISGGATANSAITVLLYSETVAGASGPAANFDPLRDYDWVIARAAGGITGFAPERFRIDRAGFQNSVGNGTFYLTLVGGTEVHLNFSPVPEPGSLILTAIAATSACLWSRRSRKKRDRDG